MVDNVFQAQANFEKYLNLNPGGLLFFQLAPRPCKRLRLLKGGGCEQVLVLGKAAATTSRSWWKTATATKGHCWCGHGTPTGPWPAHQPGQPANRPRARSRTEGASQPAWSIPSSRPRLSPAGSWTKSQPTSGRHSCKEHQGSGQSQRDGQGVCLSRGEGPSTPFCLLTGESCYWIQTINIVIIFSVSGILSFWVWTCQCKSNSWQLAWLARNKFCARLAQQVVSSSRVIQPCPLNICFIAEIGYFQQLKECIKAAWKCGWFILLQTLSNQALLPVVPHGFYHRHMAPLSAPHGRLRTSQASSGDIDDISDLI